MGGRQVAPARANGFSTIDGWLARNATIEHLLQEARAAKAAAERRVAEVKQRVRGEVDKSQLAGRVKAVLGSSPPGRRIAPSSAQARNRPRSNTGPTPRDQVLAGLRGAQDAFTLGLGDRIYAGGGALSDAAHGEDLGDAWSRRFAVERARDDYDGQHFRTARTAGQIAGTVAGIGATGGVDALLYGGARLAKAAPMVGREFAALTLAGGAGGGAMQALTDLQRGRQGSWRDYAGAAVGGGTAALLSRYGSPGLAAAAGGATRSVTQDVLNGRRPSAENVSRAAQADGYFAAPLGLAARAWSKGLSIADKGKLGEALGQMRTLANFDLPTSYQMRVPIMGGPKYTVVDHLTKLGKMTEQKFGESARLSKNQVAALNQFGKNIYRVDSFLPRDVGAIVAFGPGLLQYQPAETSAK